MYMYSSWVLSCLGGKDKSIQSQLQYNHKSTQGGSFPLPPPPTGYNPELVFIYEAMPLYCPASFD